MVHPEEMKIRDLVNSATGVLKRASAGPDDIGSRYARLLELLWKQPKSVPVPAETSPAGTGTGTQHLQMQSPSQNSLPNPPPEPTAYVHFSPANDFSWLDLEAVGDFVSGDQTPGAGMLGFDAFHNQDLYQDGPDRLQSSQIPAWPGDMTSSLLF